MRGQFNKQWDAGGLFNYIVYCQGYVAVSSTQGHGSSFCRNGFSIPLTETWVDTVDMKGQVTAKWYRGPTTWSSYCDVTGQPPCYTYTGSFAITVTPVAKNLTLTAVPSMIHSGDTVTFTASAGGSSFTVQEWIWQPDEPPGSSSTGSCTAGVSQCDAVINESGTMYVRASVKGFIEQASARVTILPTELTVSCTPSPVYRGQEVICSVVVPEGAPPPTISQWKFTSADLSEPIFEQTSNTVWEGIAATSGEVTVTGTLDGDSISGSGEIVVQERNWRTDTVRYQVVEKPQGERLPEKPTRVGDLGGTANHGGIFPLSEHYGQITSGPQNGVWYWLHTPAQGESWIYINRTSLAVNSAFYGLQPTTPTTPDSCAQSAVVPFLPLVIAHEGLNVDPGSHAETFRRKMNELVPQATEPVVSLGTSQDLEAKTTAQTQDEIDLARLVAGDTINGGTVLPVPYCYFRYF